MKVIVDVTSCKQCPYWHHPHNDAPWCNYKNGPLYISNSDVIDPNCPIAKELGIDLLAGL